MKIWKILFLFFFFSCNSQENFDFSIIQVDEFGEGFSQKTDSHKEEYFLVSNHTAHFPKSDTVNVFLCERLKLYRDNLNSYHAHFYQETKLVNLESIKNNDEAIDIYGKHIGTYIWRASSQEMKVYATKYSFGGIFKEEKEFRVNPCE